MGTWLTDTITSMGALGVLLLTFLENVFPPIPSELIMPLAGYLASQGRMNVYAAVAAGTAGSLLGAVLLYWVGHRIGEERLKAFADRHGRWLTFSRQDIERASAWFDRHGGWAVFFCRLIPGIRSLISIPAGIQHMGLVRFLAWSLLGTAIWTGALVWAGYALGRNFERVGEYVDPVSTAVLAAAAAYYLWRVVRHKGAGPATQP